MICPQCQRENLPDSIFCDRCGMRFETVCSHCDEPNRLDATFCRICGQLIDQTATTAPARVAGVPTPDSYVPKHLAEKILASRQSLAAIPRRRTEAGHRSFCRHPGLDEADREPRSRRGAEDH